MENEESKEKSATEIIEDVKEKFCDNYCKYPDQYSDYDQMLDEQCSKCVLNLL